MNGRFHLHCALHTTVQILHFMVRKWQKFSKIKYLIRNAPVLWIGFAFGKFLMEKCVHLRVKYIRCCDFTRNINDTLCESASGNFICIIAQNGTFHAQANKSHGFTFDGNEMNDKRLLLPFLCRLFYIPKRIAV